MPAGDPAYYEFPHVQRKGSASKPRSAPQQIEVCALLGGAESAKNVVTRGRQERKVALTASGYNATSLRSRLSGRPACSLKCVPECHRGSDIAIRSRLTTVIRSRCLRQSASPRAEDQS